MKCFPSAHPALYAVCLLQEFALPALSVFEPYFYPCCIAVAPVAFGDGELPLPDEAGEVIRAAHFLPGILLDYAFRERQVLCHFVALQPDSSFGKVGIEEGILVDAALGAVAHLQVCRGIRRADCGLHVLALRQRLVVGKSWRYGMVCGKARRGRLQGYSYETTGKEHDKADDGCKAELDELAPAEQIELCHDEECKCPEDDTQIGIRHLGGGLHVQPCSLQPQVERNRNEEPNV